SGGCNSTVIWFRDKPPVPEGQEPDVGVQWASPGWFGALRVPLLRGRVFTGTDRLGAPKVVVVNAAAARRFWPDEDALGKRIGVGQGGFADTATVVGVVGDVRFGTVDSLEKADVFIPYGQSPSSRMIVFIRTSGDPVTLAPSARAAIREIALGVPVYDLRPLTDRVADASAQTRFSAILLSLFAGMALVLAALGIYGVMSFVVAQRTREIGIRVALGALGGEVATMVLRQALGFAALGTGIGLVAALLATRVLRSLLFDVQPTDSGTYLVIVPLLVVAALVASWLPARRATRIHPMEALRSE
ncbi:MAG TPA: FtsX-like permease family protein, partial [Gemmatimonadales bacterium]|nr:FtsX-like permease family protein [Gemmatimonadales bacterium]